MEILLGGLCLAGAVTHLLRATRMVRTGVERAYGSVLEQQQKNARGSRVDRVFLGALAEMLPQSGSAAAVLARELPSAVCLRPARRWCRARILTPRRLCTSCHSTFPG